MRALFFGTPQIAVPALEALCDTSEIVGVICQPDRPAGRGLELSAPAVKKRALELGLDVAQPSKIRGDDFAGWVESKHADFALVIAYGRILPPRVLAAPKSGCINLHASLLPRYRGAAPINWAIARGEKETGISLMRMDEGCDTGPVFTRRLLAIGDNDTAGELADRLAELARVVVREELPRAISGQLVATAQDQALATMAPMLTKLDGLVAWQQSAREVHDRARAMTPWPGAHSTISGKRFKLLETRIASEEGQQGAPGELLELTGNRARVACGQGSIHIVRGQVEGKKALDAAELAAGRTIALGTRFGS
jgi:methionyl-tRNA formyltransferase